MAFQCKVGVVTMWTLICFSFMNWLNVSLKILSPCKVGVAIWTFICYSLMNWLNVCLKIAFPLSLICTHCALKSFSIMNWLFMSLYTWFKSCFVITSWTSEGFFHDLLLFGFSERYFRTGVMITKRKKASTQYQSISGAPWSAEKQLRPVAAYKRHLGRWHRHQHQCRECRECSVESVVWTSDWSHPGDPATQCRPATQATPPQYDTLSLKIDFSAGVRWPFRHHHYRLVFSWIASSKWVLGPRVLQQLSWSSYTSSVSVGVKNIE